jgi:hypothetical protein
METTMPRSVADRVKGQVQDFLTKSSWREGWDRENSTDPKVQRCNSTYYCSGPSWLGGVAKPEKE